MKDSINLENKIIVISGASSGIGRSCAINCDKNGARLVLISRNQVRLKQTVSLLSKRNHIIISVDLTDFNDLKLKLKKLFTEINCIHGIINAAGISLTMPFKFFKPKHLEDTFKINVTAAFYLTKLLLPNFDKNGGSIVFLSSIMSNISDKGKTIYSITKGAVSSGTRSLALEYAAKKIRVNSVAPGIVKTPMTKNSTYMTNKDLNKKTLDSYPLGFGEPEDISNVCIFLISDAAKWITGSEIVIDGGFSAK